MTGVDTSWKEDVSTFQKFFFYSFKNDRLLCATADENFAKLQKMIDAGFARC